MSGFEVGVDGDLVPIELYIYVHAHTYTNIHTYIHMHEYQASRWTGMATSS